MRTHGSQQIFRMFRALRFLRELRVIVMSIVGSLTAVVRSLLEIVFVLLLFSPRVLIGLRSGDILDT